MATEQIQLLDLSQPALNIAAGGHDSIVVCKSGLCIWGKSRGQQQWQLGVDCIAASTDHGFGWRQNTVYCWGSNEAYCLGLEEEKEYPETKIELFEEAFEAGYQLKDITCGDRHTIAVFEIQNDEGEQQYQIFSWGLSKNHQLGLDTSAIVPYPVLIDFQVHVKAIHSRSDYNIVLDDNGTCYSWGSNIFARMGFPNQIKTHTFPTPIPLHQKIASLSLGMYHVMGITEEGKVLAWGHGFHGQLGIDQIVAEIQPTQVLVYQPAKEVACGESHSLILLQSGELLSCGSNAQGALGHNSVDSKKRCKKPMPIEQVSGLEIDKIVCGNRHNLLLTAKGEVYSWGCNKYGQLGHKKQGKPTKEELLCDWKKRYSEFKQEQAKKEAKFMAEFDKIVSS